jgi:aminoglycoside phosphotransferase (APT) family kinase protein
MPDDESAKPKTSTRDRGEIAARLAEWLRAVTGADMLPVVSGLRGPDKGGLSSETLLADLTWSVKDEHHRRSVVVRLPPPPDSWPVFPSYDLGRQAIAMEAVRRGSAVPIPEVLWFEPDPEPLGAPFIVMARVDGVAAPDYMPYTWGSWLTDMTADEQSQVADACIDLLVDIHGVELSAETTTALELHNFEGSSLRRHVASERARYEWAREGRAFPTIERAFAVLDAQWPAYDGDPCISWGDARLGNILWSGVEPVAVLDWEMVALAPPAVDLGWMLFFVEYFQRSAERQGKPGIPGFLARDASVERYERATGTAISEPDWYLLYAALRQAIVSIRTMGRAVHFGEMPAPAEPEGLVLDLAFLAQLIDAVGGG